MKSFASLLIAACGLCALPLVATQPLLAAPAPVRVRVELDRPVLPAGSTETAVVKIALDGLRRPAAQRAPVNLALVIDKSGSMGGEKIERARDAAREAVRRLSADDVVSLIVYDSGVRVLVPAGRVGDGEALHAAIAGIRSGGGTALHDGVVAGADELRKHIEGGYTHRVVLLSDGQANVGPQTPEALGSLGALLVREGISVTTVGLGLDYNEDLMARLARRSDGNTYFVARADDLARVFGEELGDVLDVVARRVRVDLEFPAGVRPVRVVGREGRIEDGRARIELNQLYGGQEKFALVEVEIAPGRKDGHRDIVRARVDYLDATDGRTRTAEARAAVRFTDDEAAVLTGANRQVQADYAVNRLAEAKSEAVALVDAGRRDQAAARLREVGDSLSTLGKIYSNSAVLDIAAPAAPAAASVEAFGLSNGDRKRYRSETEQVYNQQRAE